MCQKHEGFSNRCSAAGSREFISNSTSQNGSIALREVSGLLTSFLDNPYKDFFKKWCTFLSF